MKANTKTIFKHLYEQMIKLDKKEITVEDAKAQANLAKQANNILNYQLNLAIAKSKFDDFVITEIQES
jgi:hypothetical protein